MTWGEVALNSFEVHKSLVLSGSRSKEAIGPLFLSLNHVVVLFHLGLLPSLCLGTVRLGSLWKIVF